MLIQRLQEFLDLPPRYRWTSRKQYARDTTGLLVSRAVDRFNCLIGKHRVKFGSHPYCVNCNKIPRSNRLPKEK